MLSFLCPETRHPAITVAFCVPVAGHPASVWWNVAPDPADPDEIGLSVIPSPITRNPLNVVSFWLVFRRNFIDQFWRCIEDQRRGLRISLVGRRERFMQWPASQDVQIFGNFRSRLLQFREGQVLKNAHLFLCKN